jgi:hypothetical protein
MLALSKTFDNPSVSTFFAALPDNLHLPGAKLRCPETAQEL